MPRNNVELWVDGKLQHRATAAEHHTLHTQQLELRLASAERGKKGAALLTVVVLLTAKPCLQAPAGRGRCSTIVCSSVDALRKKTWALQQRL